MSIVDTGRKRKRPGYACMHNCNQRLTSAVRIVIIDIMLHLVVCHEVIRLPRKVHLTLSMLHLCWLVRVRPLQPPDDAPRKQGDELPSR
jgi:hypothetical protein